MILSFAKRNRKIREKASEYGQKEIFGVPTRDFAGLIGETAKRLKGLEVSINGKNTKNIEAAFVCISEYCHAHKGKTKVHCFDNGCIFCRQRLTMAGIRFLCKLRELT